MRLLIVSTILILASWPTIAGPDYPFPEELAERQGRAAASSKTPERLLAAATATSASATPAADASPEAPPPDADRNLSREVLCEALASAAQANDLPVGFFVRLIWQESRFIATAVSRAGAQGVAQFMPAVAAELGLSDPFDPLQALPKSAEFLRALRREFGNLGLAAAAYNAGTGRIKSWLERRAKLPQQVRGRARLPKETHHYVTTITGHAPEHWVNGAPENVDFAAEARVPCRDEIEADQAPQVEMPVRMADADGSVSSPRQRLQALPPPAATPPSARARAPARAALLKPHAPRPEVRRTEAVALKPWGVQLAGNWSETKARETFERLRKKHPAILGKREPQVVRTRLAGKGAAMNRIQIALDTRAGAEQLCSALKSAGGACMVMRN
jgi:soluble lytic murein transglycosylase-like protein